MNIMLTMLWIKYENSVTFHTIFIILFINTIFSHRYNSNNNKMS